jgi:RimJ/RimL family protein N-acetyltransferase
MVDNRRMPQAVLRSRRITLVPLSDEHFEYEVELETDPDVMRYLTGGRPRTRAEVEWHHRFRMASAERVPGLGCWVGFVEGRFVGWWLLQPPERPDQGPVEGQGELGYRLAPRHWRKGLAGEGARALIRHGFSDLGLTRIFAETMAVNTASRATMASVGLEYTRTYQLEWDEPIPGTEQGEVEYAITRDRWLAQQSDQALSDDGAAAQR